MGEFYCKIIELGIYKVDIYVVLFKIGSNLYRGNFF